MIHIVHQVEHGELTNYKLKPAKCSCKVSVSSTFVSRGTMERLGVESKHDTACCSFGLGRRAHVGRDNRGSVGDGLWISAGKFIGLNTSIGMHQLISEHTYMDFDVKHEISILFR